MKETGQIRLEVVTYEAHADAIVEVRKQVFVEEQNVPVELEIDGLDPEAKHVLVFAGDRAVGTGRLLPDGHIGRVAVKKPYRGSGIGKQIMEVLIKTAGEAGLSEVWLSSQCHARGFYEKLGFVAIGEVYQEAGIDHIKMKKTLVKSS